jgi:hypothetical protein
MNYPTLTALRDDLRVRHPEASFVQCTRAVVEAAERGYVVDAEPYSAEPSWRVVNAAALDRMLGGQR